MELKVIKGINVKREADFKKLGIFDTADLIRFFPKNYLDLRCRLPLKDAYDNEFALTDGTVISLPNIFTTRSRKNMVKIVCEQDGCTFNVIWFNQPYILKKLQVGKDYLFYGRVSLKRGYTIINPSFEELDKNYRLKGVIPQYPCIKGNISQKVCRDAVKVAINVEKPTTIIPFQLVKKYNLMNLSDAYRTVHNPIDFNSLQTASERIAVEEYFSLISAFKIIKGDNTTVRVNRYNCSKETLLEFISKLPFELTDGQKNAVNEIYHDMKGESVMNRLMQGDVGCGKTAVALISMFIAVESGYQVAMLAPTEVLAKQNYNIVKKYFGPIVTDILTGSLTAREKRLAKDKVRNGFTKILVGTHAILEEDVMFANLSLCICDEQQRFGVSQRSALLNKGNQPDVLVMSATPIPRTLALIVYGDLDITTIKDKPSNRKEVQTNIVPSVKYRDMLQFIVDEIKKGRQAYFVSPKIEGDEEGEMISVTKLYETLSSIMPDVKFALLHGKMKDFEKNAVMQDFKEGKFDALISTTVIEVGVDVPNANVMVIYNAERFGLSQLHQLRGRVGRSDIKSYCFLLSDKESEISKKRLSILTKTTDGFKISEEDFAIRGGGDFMGERQSGKFMHDLGALQYSTEAIFLAKKISDEAFDLKENILEIKKVAIKKYEKLKNITMN